MNPRVVDVGAVRYETSREHIGQTALFDLFEVTTVVTPNSGWPNYTPLVERQKESISVLKRVRDIDLYCELRGIDIKKAAAKSKRRDKRDRPKTFFTLLETDTTESYVKRWLSANHLGERQ